MFTPPEATAPYQNSLSVEIPKPDYYPSAILLSEGWKDRAATNFNFCLARLRVGQKHFTRIHHPTRAWIPLQFTN